MCLEYAKRINRIFKRNITCYKILKLSERSYSNTYISNEKYLRVNRQAYEMYSIFYDTRYYFTKVNKVSGEPIIYTSCLNAKKNWVEGNAIHTFKRKKDAIKYAEDFTGAKGAKYIVVKCTIPKDSLFIYKGKFNKFKGYASQKLKLVKIVHTTNPHIIINKELIENLIKNEY